MPTIDFIALVFAASAIVDVWLNGSIFEQLRSYFQARADAWALPDDAVSQHADSTVSDEPQPLWMRLLGWLPDWACELITCQFCLSHHTPWLLAAALLCPALFVPEPWGFVVKIPIYSLAATRLGNLINAWAPPSARYERGSAEFLEDPNDE